MRIKNYFHLIVITLLLSLIIESPVEARQPKHISKNNSQKIKIALWGDSREDRDNATSDIAHILLYKITDWDFQVHTGDFTHDGSEAAWQRTLHFQGIDSIYVKGKFYMCTSNHDYKNAESEANWDKYTKGILPVNSSDGTTHFYAVHKGNVDVIFCDGYFTDPSIMNKWLENYLSKIDPDDWIIGVWHNVSYGDLTYKKSYLGTCLPWIKILYKHHCKFIFNGHAHVYVRTKPLDPDEKIDYKHGIVTVINGTGGASWKDPVKSNNRIAFTPKVRSFPTVTFLTFSGNKASLETVDCRPGHHLKVIDKCDYEK